MPNYTVNGQPVSGSPSTSKGIVDSISSWFGVKVPTYVQTPVANSAAAPQIVPSMQGMSASTIVPGALCVDPSDLPADTIAIVIPRELLVPYVR